MKVIAFGEIVWDVYPDNACLGGAPLNFAAHLARHGHDVYMVSAVGTDDYGDRALAQMHDWGVRTDCVARLTDKRTGACIVTLDDAGVPQYDLLSNTAYDHIPPADALTADVLYFGTLALRSEYNRETLQRLLHTSQVTDVFVDVNVRAPFYSQEVLRFAAEHATILKISDEELPTVAKTLSVDTAQPQAFIKQITARYPCVQCLILTRGGDGAMVYHRAEDTVYTCASKKVEVVSTVGAGDSFSAAFLHSYNQQDPIPQCAAYAAAVAGFVVSRQEAVPPYDPKEF